MIHYPAIVPSYFFSIDVRLYFALSFVSATVS
jgi:hypothetical protein